MTLDESSKLSPEQLRVAVAERLGWKLIQNGGHKIVKSPDGMERSTHAPGVTGEELFYHVIPPFEEDLNACAEMESTLTDEQREKYCSLLMPQWDDEDRAIWRDVFDALSATATQRCRAFLAVSGNEL